MSVSDFLFNGSPPPSVTTYGTATAGLPQWYSDYTTGILGAANAIAAEPYQAYGAPRIADFTADQQASFDKTRADVGAWNPTMNQATGAVQDATQMSGVGAAQPYFNQSSQSAASTVGDYMNPYTDAVVDRIGDLGARNLNEKFMPAIGDAFTRAGQFGSTRMQDATGRAVRDTQESTLAAQNQALQQGYGQAMTAAQNDLTRYGNLGQAAGNLTNTGQSNLTAAGGKLGDLATAGQSLDLRDTAALSSIGGQQQQLDQQNENTAYQDFLDQRDYPKQQVGFLNNALHGIAVPQSSTTTNTGPAASYSASPLASLTGGLAGISALFKAKGGLVRQNAPRRRIKEAC